jgi:hypothetical protein
VVLNPVGQLGDAHGDFAARVGEVVLDALRYLEVCRAFDEPVVFERLDGLGEHLVADSGDLPFEFAETVRPVEQADEHEHTPSAGDVFEHAA